MQRYYALGNVVYKEGDGEVVCVIAPVWLLKSTANLVAYWTACSLNDSGMLESDVLRGSLD